MTHKPNILFLCTGNSCRSQMAEGYARYFHGDKINAYSAGIEADGMKSATINVMQEDGVDISQQHSKSVETVLHIPFDLVITLCDHASEHCPIFPQKTKVIHHGFADPYVLAKGITSEEEVLAIYRRVRDQIKIFIKADLSRHL